jgi:PKD repeat protein
VRHEKTHIWVVDLNPYLTTNSTTSSGSNVTFTAVAFDPGADDLTFYWDFGDGTNMTTNYPNNNTTYPVNIADVVKHSYSMSGSYIVKLIVRDDDGGEAIVKVTIKVD